MDMHAVKATDAKCPALLWGISPLNRTLNWNTALGSQAPAQL